MKKINKYLVLLFLIALPFNACDLEEDPPYVLEDDIYTSVSGLDTALNGIFNAFIHPDSYRQFQAQLIAFTSGMFISGRAQDRTDIAALSPYPSQNYTSNVWRGTYRAIHRANDLIANVNPETKIDAIRNGLGVAYFLRAFSYFNLVQLWGGVPLHLAPVDGSTLSAPRASVQEVYDQIISDCKKAEELMWEPEQQRAGRPGKYAANMLMAKAYMAMATMDGQNNMEYWQKAYDEAIKVYGKHSLLPNYRDLWMDASVANNSAESLFEIQFNSENPSAMGRLYSADGIYYGRTWKRVRANPETIDQHMAAYPDDPRIDYTFISTWYSVKKGKTLKTYPDTPRKNFNASFPYIYKYTIKDPMATTDATNFNVGVYRYADLLLMLGEISNELGNTVEAEGYVNEVLARARNSKEGGAAEPADWNGLGQDEFREKIMKEYQFELLGEGQDWFNTHRRGYEWFKTHVIDVHNARNEKPYDIEYPDNTKVMLMPIPTDEINANNDISQADQNPGY